MRYLLENSHGGNDHELKIANSLNAWFIRNKLSFSAARSGNDNLKSDIVVTDLRIGKSFYIECKKEEKDQLLNIAIKIDNNLKFIAVLSHSHEPLTLSTQLKNLLNKLMNTPQYALFKEFMLTETPLLKDENGKKLVPKDVWMLDADVSLKSIDKLVAKYNRILDNSSIRKDDDNSTIKRITLKARNHAAVALAWRFSQYNKIYLTFDISTVLAKNVMSKLVALHYQLNKESVKYICIGNKIYIFDLNDNPLNIKCTTWPKTTDGIVSIRFKRDRGGSSKDMNMPPSSNYHITTRAVFDGQLLPNTIKVENMQLLKSK